jgi:imidazole glycerol-phosphate synthase subunit HisF
MLKIRLIGVLVIKEGIVVQSIGFNTYLPVGSPKIAIDYLNQWGIDEIIVLDIDSAKLNIQPDFTKMKGYFRNCHVPLAFGGGIRTVEQIKKIIQSGADKVSINSGFFNNLELIEEGARLFGSQCIVVSIDAKKDENGLYRAFVNSGKKDTGVTPIELAKKAEESGAGEILINSIDRDGTKKGYDLSLIQQITESVDIPVIACGGVGHPIHFAEALTTIDVSAVAAANFFHFSEQSVTTTKSYLEARNCDMRLDSYATYRGYQFDELGRIAKIDDQNLEKLRFEYIPEEVI